MSKSIFEFNQNKRGYGLFIADGSEFYIPNAIHIEKIDGIDKFQDDEEASIQAKKDGIPFINDIKGVPVDIYIDTKENRLEIEKSLKEFPQYLQVIDVNGYMINVGDKVWDLYTDEIAKVLEVYKVEGKIRIQYFSGENLYDGEIINCKAEQVEILDQDGIYEAEHSFEIMMDVTQDWCK